jgi:NADPH:quinone reductase-like Zn-dependent oxidoreductase
VDLAEVAEPQLRCDRALVAVKAISLNRGARVLGMGRPERRGPAGSPFGRFARRTGVCANSTMTDPVSYPTRSCLPARPAADLIAAGRLDPQVGMVRQWEDAGDAVEALLARRIAGKAVLTLS